MSTWSVTGTSTDNTELTIIRPAEPARAHYILSVVAAFDIVPSSGVTLEVLDGSNVLVSTFVSDPPYFILNIPFLLSGNSDAVVRIGAAGVGIKSKLTLLGFTLP